MFHTNVVPAEQLFTRRDERQPREDPWEELAPETIDLIATEVVSPGLHVAGYTPMGRLLESGLEMSYGEYIWVSCSALCVEALAKQREGRPMTLVEMLEGTTPREVAKTACKAAMMPPDLDIAA